jgi:hypothetical protein
MTRRSLFKLLALLPWVGPTVVQALTKAGPAAKTVYAPYLPAFFPKWNRAIDGLEDAGKWVSDIEQALLPRDIVFPQVGQIWEAVRNCEVTFRASICVPESDTELLLKKCGPKFISAHLDLLARGGRAQLPQGEKVRIVGIVDYKPLYVVFKPIRYDELHERIVPEGVRLANGYCGYELSLKIARTISDFDKANCQTYFNEVFRPVTALP